MAARDYATHISIIRFTGTMRGYNQELMSGARAIYEYRDEILGVVARHGAGNARFFGSAARGAETPDSDIDLLVDGTGVTTPWFPGSLAAELEQLLGKRVQVVIRRSLSPLIREAVLREAVPI